MESSDYPTLFSPNNWVTSQAWAAILITWSSKPFSNFGAVFACYCPSVQLPRILSIFFKAKCANRTPISLLQFQISYKLSMAVTLVFFQKKEIRSSVAMRMTRRKRTSACCPRLSIVRPYSQPAANIISYI